MARFTGEILPSLEGRAGRLLVELLAPPSGCEKARARAQQESDAITEGQAEDNQNEYVALGHAARTYGIVPDVLRPTCKDMESTANAEVPVIAIMELIARASERSVEAWLPHRKPERPLIVLYGGALHNDVQPREGVESWSYAARMTELSGSGYREIDLVLPELVQDSESWRKFLWYEAMRSLPERHGFVLVLVSETSYALVLPRGAFPGE